MTAIRAATRDAEPAVRVAAETTLYRLGLRGSGPTDLRSVLAPAIDHEDAGVRDVACRELRDLLIEDPCGDPGQVGAGRPEWHARLGLLVSALFRPVARAAAASAIADVAARRRRLVSPAAAEMLALADDPDPRVRAAVLRFIGYTQWSEKARLLAERLAAHHPDEAAAAAEGVRALGPAALDALLPEFSFGRRSVRDAIVPLLRELDVHPEAFAAQLRRELEGVAERLLEFAALRGRAEPLLVQRLEERVQGGLHTVFLLLAALHDDDRIADLGDALARPQTPRDRALRVEGLEALLSPDERQRLIPFVEDPRAEPRIAAARALLGRRPLSREATIEAMMEDPDPLTRLLLGAGEAHAPHAAAGRPEGSEGSMLSDVEVLLQLRSFKIFEQLTVRELADVARLVRQEEFAPAAAIVREGEFESSMYAITEGRVEVTKKGAPLAELRAGEIFGEMAIFDGEARSATVTAIEPTRVLRIEGKDLMALMEELPGIAIAICRTLSRLVRRLSAQSAG
ncbi:MAG: cyclic nucleotide-binding domain-containing protein [Deltaproteobacteria bacterium]|nr:cyclic nucleotide-binding domain-containing protein [Deltaproteobacteria bacterium]